jgi:hypothetical protein
MTVHLVNLTNPMMMKGPIREFVPVGPHEVTLPSGIRPRRIQLLVSGAAVPAGRTVRVPRIVDHEVVAVDL